MTCHGCKKIITINIPGISEPEIQVAIYGILLCLYYRYLHVYVCTAGIYTNLEPITMWIEDPGSIKNAICEDHELAELCQRVSA